MAWSVIAMDNGARQVHESLRDGAAPVVGEVIVGFEVLGYVGREGRRV